MIPGIVLQQRLPLKGTAAFPFVEGAVGGGEDKLLKEGTGYSFEFSNATQHLDLVSCTQ